MHAPVGHRRSTGRFAAAGCLLLFSFRCHAQEAQTDELRAIREQLVLIRREQQQMAALVRAIRASLSGEGARAKGAPLDTVSIGTRDLPVRGNQTAKVAVVEFSDYQCPYCLEHFKNTMPVLEERYISSGKIRYYIIDFPLEPIHPQAEQRAEATRCAGEIDRYWELRASLFTNQTEGNMEKAIDSAIPSSERAGFDKCMKEARYAARVRDDIEEGKRVGIDGTPEFLVGYLDPNHPGEFKPVRKLSGAVSADDFEVAIESAQEARPQESGGHVNQSALGDPVMPESSLRAAIGQSVPAVRAEDLRRVWSLLSEQASGVSVDMKVLAAVCDANANVLAVFLRATLVSVLMQQTGSDRWREGSGVRDKVFEVAAAFPLPRGVENADLPTFVAALQ